MQGIPPRGVSKPHTEECRQRIEAAIRTEDKDKYERYEERVNTKIIRHIKRKRKSEEETEQEERQATRNKEDQRDRGEKRKAEEHEDGDIRDNKVRVAGDTEDDEADEEMSSIMATGDEKSTPWR